MILEDGSWALLRLSGTESVVRIYCEAPSQTELESLLQTTQAFVLGK